VKNTGTFIKTISSVDINSIVTLIDFNQILAPYKQIELDAIVEHAIVLEDLQAKVGLFSLLEAGWEETNAISTEAQKQAEQAKIKHQGQKIYLGCYHAYGNGPWIKKGEEILQNKNSLEQPWALMSPFFSTNETALIDEDLKIGLKIESKAQGIGGLKGTDYLTVFGGWRKVTSKEWKKNPIQQNLSNNPSISTGGAIEWELGTESKLILPDRSAFKNRKEFMIFNPSNEAILFNYSKNVTSSIFVSEILPGGFWQDLSNNQGAIFARAKNNIAKINVTELVII
jgi:hypothetical protein